jgi:hypothetical protein
MSFYGVAILFVMALFSVTTNYGEANLKAPMKIAGRYRITAKNLPGCLKSEPLVLSIEQSGIYLSGSLLEADERIQTQTAAKKKPDLTGLWENQNLSLSGDLIHLRSCEPEELTIQIQGSIAKNLLKGTLKLGSETVPFIARREENQEKHN